MSKLVTEINLSDRLVSFALSVLQLLERESEWDADTLNEVSEISRELGLSEDDAQGLFSRADDVFSFSKKFELTE